MHTNDRSVLTPLVFLDIDGVVNDLNSLFNGGVKGINKIKANSYFVHIPDYMPELIQLLVEHNEVVWLTTWRENANDEIREHLGIPPLQVLTDGGTERSVRWKPAAAYEMADKALKNSRQVWWIEDFYRELPHQQMPIGVNYVDTAATTNHPVLTEDMLPGHLLGR